MSKKIEDKFKKDIEPLLSNNLSFDQIKDRIEIEESQIYNINDNEITHTQKYLTQPQNTFWVRNWKLLTLVTSIILVVSLTILQLTNSSDYMLSPFNDQLQGVIFGGQIKSLINKNTTFSDILDYQKNTENPLYFYEVEMYDVDKYYTCAYFPTEYYTELKNKIDNSDFYDNFLKDINLIDGKLVYYYSELYNNKINVDKYKIKWYQVDKKDKIPHKIDDYSLGLVLSSRDIYFKENKTSNITLNFKKKIFLREYYNIQSKNMNNELNNNYFVLTINDKNLLLTTSYISNENEIKEINFLTSYNFTDKNNIIIPKINKSNINVLGHYQNDLEQIEVSTFVKDNITYGEYDYQKFCELAF